MLGVVVQDIFGFLIKLIVGVPMVWHGLCHSAIFIGMIVSTVSPTF
jgi:hypothetical protein